MPYYIRYMDDMLFLCPSKEQAWDALGKMDEFLRARLLARAAVRAMGGQGAGGKPDFAQGGAPDGSRAEDGLSAVRAALS